MSKTKKEKKTKKFLMSELISIFTHYGKKWGYESDDWSPNQVARVAAGELGLELSSEEIIALSDNL